MQTIHQEFPYSVQQQLNELNKRLIDILGNDLTGIYLHGSLAMGCFNPARSDIDILAVSSSSLSFKQKETLLDYLLEISNNPHPLEISVLSEASLHPWKHPSPFEFHYSEA
ncbi:nucleotidyltransferase domain-containing protein [Pseudalkalibacillus caeni]|uniref:Nucleotidyltransferase domain-containing protein n=1 Tax=Exobacillus caeni TaxID=2574798 RepID=A0A5R9F6B7_9BACL|nr:nucleotidyltransferase domain-containing protein [Pseudalkalibacillus caeni]TLS38039.1 nucleotidyltransferase domain-containing protein [Pseudalkalibacillus caeni]